MPEASYTYSQVFMAVELLKHLVKLDHYNVCQLAFSQLNFMSDLSERPMPGILDRASGFVRRSLRRSIGSLKKSDNKQKDTLQNGTVGVERTTV